MDDKVRHDILASAMLHSFRESIPDEFSDPYSDMDSIEKSKLIIELTRLRAEDQRRFDALLEKLDAMAQAQVDSTNEAAKLRSQISELMTILDEYKHEIAKLKKENLALKEQRKLSNKTTYGSKSQKTGKNKDNNGHDDEMPDRQRQKDEFDGNNIAERNIRPLAGERKNSLFFGSDRLAVVSAAYHTVISTCRAQGISALTYLKTFFREVALGRSDYENLMPMTIGNYSAIRIGSLTKQTKGTKIFDLGT